LQSLNFEILRNRWPELAELGASAEEYAYSDPQSAMLKLRCFAELIVNHIYKDLNLSFDSKWDFFKKLKDKEFNKIISRFILDKFHAIRIKGNKAVHNNDTDIDAVWLIKEAYCIACWICLNYKECTNDKCKEFVTPINNGHKINNLNETIKQLENTLEQEREKYIVPNNLNRNDDQIETFTNSNNNIANSMNLSSEEISKRISMKDIFADYTLTKEQANLLEELNIFLSNKDEHIFLLKGYAGTGKTFMTKGLTEYLTAIGRNYVLAAPTGKAAKVIKEKTEQDAFTIHKTIYSYKDLKEYIVENEDGSETFKFYFDLASNEHSNDTIYIIDESSMIGDTKQEGEFFRFGSGKLLTDLLTFINLDHNDHNKKIIFIGDDAQLPPVGMNYSPALETNYLKENFNFNSRFAELKEVVRQQKDSGILHNSTNLRDSIKKNIFTKLQFNLEFNDTNHVEHENLLEKYLLSCNYKINGESIIIASTNNVVDEYNTQIRKHFFPNNSQICAGDKVMATTNNNTFGVFVYNGDFGLVKSVANETIKREVFVKHKFYNETEMSTIKVPLWFKKVEIGFKDENEKAYFFECYILENILYRNIVYKDLDNILKCKQLDINSIETKALYVDFVNRARERGLKSGSEEFKQAIKSDKYFNCLKVKFGYAITCHKSQGSEWNNVFVNCKTHEQSLSKNYFRWIYTAITRAKKNLYTLDEPHIGIFDGIDTNVQMEHIQSTQTEVTTTRIDTSNDNPFNIGDRFLQELYKKIAAIVNVNNIKILNLQHNQNQEQYTFESNNEQSRVIMYYNAQNIVTAINPIETNNLSNLLKAILEPLKNHILTVEGHTDFTFDENFLEDFYLTLKEKLNNDIIIANIEHLNYMERYTFSRKNEIAIIDFYYNEKGQFKSPTPNNKSNSQLLIKDIIGNL
jgi:ATP-dependent exoDNAse (exonuclease V) alpha subunit